MFLALVLFVGIPVLGTGAWTGILAASILELDFKESIGACFCGVLLADVDDAIFLDACCSYLCRRHSHWS